MAQSRIRAKRTFQSDRKGERRMHSETIVYQADGLNMRGEVYVGGDSSARRPAVLVFPEAFGLGDHALTRAEQIAALGYVAFACDLHGDRIVHDDLNEVMTALGALKSEPQRIRARARAALDALLTRPEVDPARVAAIGYCFGGTMALEMARGGEPILGAVGFHSGLAPVNADAANEIAARILVCIGADDPSIDQAQRNAFEAEMGKAGADWQMHLYGGVVHSFTNKAADARGMPAFARYDANADARSWASMRHFFDEIFGSAGANAG
jgi:dienelactone hydrolase